MTDEDVTTDEQATSDDATTSDDGTSDDGTTTHEATGKPRMVGFNHVALPVGDADAAEAFYRDVFDAAVRGRTEGGVFLDAGDQFLALMAAEEAAGPADGHRHVGLVVDDRDAVADRLDAVEAEVLDTGGLDFRDPWGNRIQVVAYADVQFTKADHVLAGLGADDLEKSEAALAELAEKGMAPE